MKTRQEAFDIVTSHLLTQGERSTMTDDETGGLSCAYRGERGLKCAVGCLIDDIHYHSGLEGEGVGHDGVKEALRASGWPTDWGSMELYKDLQELHDKLTEIGEEREVWKEALETYELFQGYRCSWKEPDDE